MTCSKCGKVLPINGVIDDNSNPLVCVYCEHVTPIEDIKWSDGLFHFRVIGEVHYKNLVPRVLLENQTVAKLDIPHLREKARAIIGKQPNLRAICQEFFIEDDDIHIDVLTEEKSNNAS